MKKIDKQYLLSIGIVRFSGDDSAVQDRAKEAQQ
jgi:hypothetical protein